MKITKMFFTAFILSSLLILSSCIDQTSDPAPQPPEEPAPVPVPNQADIVFIIDTTISMGEEIDGIKTTITGFLNTIADADIEVQTAAYAYADETVELRALTENYAAGSDFQNWIEGLSAGYKGQYGGDWPENGLDPIDEAMNNLSWRVQAKRFFVVITDDCFQICPENETSPFTDWTVDSLYNTLLKDKAVVHAVGKARTRRPTDDSFYNKDHEKYLSSLTGGVWEELPADGNLDLTTTGIIEAITSSFE